MARLVGSVSFFAGKQTIRTLAIFAAGVISACGSTISASSGDPGTTPGDLFDISKGTVINSSSPVIDGYDIRSLLGGTSGTGSEGPGVVLFKDINDNPWPVSNNPADYFVTFTTSTPITLAGFTLYLADDFSASPNRTVSRVRLFEAGNPVALSNVTILGSGQQNYLTAWGSHSIVVSDSFHAVTASTFTVVFTSNPLAPATSDGPRVFELDGLAGISVQSTPEPATLLLTGVGMMGLLLARKRKANAERRPR
jgi:hypothetical protein